jgi:5-methylcytosine-specific restriction endonuclease McrA
MSWRRRPWKRKRSTQKSTREAVQKLAKLSAETLRTRIETCTKSHDSLESELSAAAGEQAHLRAQRDQALRRYSELRHAIEATERADRERFQALPWTDRLFRSYRPSQAANDRLRELSDAHRKNTTEQLELRPRLAHSDQVITKITRELVDCRRKLVHLQLALARRDKADLKAAAAKAAAQRTAALAAAHLGKTRRRAATIRSQVPAGDSCPYCSRALDGNAHMDHIHPVARGGLSQPDNLVMICADCNNKKADKTLREFIREFNLDRDLIEARLEQLSKRF